MVIEVKEICEVCEHDDVILGIRIVQYQSSKNSLLEAFLEYEYGFDVDNVINCHDEFEGSVNDTVEILSVKKVIN